MISDWPAWRRIAASALFCLCIAVLVITVFQGLVAEYPLRLFQGIAVVAGGLGLLGMADRRDHHPARRTTRSPPTRRSSSCSSAAPSGSRARTSPPSPTRASS